MTDILEQAGFPVNAEGEIVATIGSGGRGIVGALPPNTVPVLSDGMVINLGGFTEEVIVVGGTTDDAEEVVKKIALAASKKSVLRFVAGRTYTFRNIPLSGGLVINATGAIIQYGGTYGTSAPLENVKVIAYAEGSVSSILAPIIIVGGTWIGAQIEGNYSNVTGGSEQDALQFNYVNGVVIYGANFKKFQQDAITFSSSPGSKVINCNFEDICDGAIEFRSGSDYEAHGNKFLRVRHMVVCKPNIDRVRVTSNIGTTFQQGIVGHGNDWLIANNTIDVYDTPDGILGNSQPAIEWSDYGGLVTPVDTHRTVITGNTILPRTNANGIIIKTPVSAYVPYDLTIANNAIECRRGILFECGVHISINGNTIKGGAGGAIQSSNASASDVIVNGNVLIGEPSTSGNGVVDTATPGIVISNNKIKTTTAAAAGIRTTSTATRTRIVGNNIDSTTAAGVVCYGSNTAIIGNSIATSAAAAIDVQGVSCSVSGNSLLPIGGEGVLIRTSRASVSGNTITSGTQGIRIGASGAGAAASNCVVNGNTITGCQYWGVNITTGAVDTIVAVNNLVGNTSGGITDAGTTTLQANNKP